jgi:hypothetical protein
MRGNLRGFGLASGLTLLLAAPALSQEASVDRAGLDAAAGRLVFQNVLLADPQAFTARARRTASLPVEKYASIGDASRDREELDVGAGRVASRGSADAASAAMAPRRPEPIQAGSKRTVRVILPSPYGQ